MSYSILPNYGSLTAREMADASYLPLPAYTPSSGNGAGYDNAALFRADYAGAENDAVFSWTGIAGAVYSITSSSHFDPAVLLVFDAYGDPIAEDDRGGWAGEDHLTFVAPYSGTYYVDASWDQGGFSSQQRVSLQILEDVSPANVQVISGTSRADDLDGTAGADDMFGFGGDDSLFGGRGDDYLDGGSGIDEAFYNGSRAEYTVHADGDRFWVYDNYGTDGDDLLSDIERIDFKDVSLALDINGEGGQAYRLYQAAFDRVPDKVGLGYWIAQLDQGASLREVSGAFVASDEFRALYGARPTNLAIVNEFYENVLNRAPDQAGLDYWVNILDTRQDTVAGVLSYFSESRENYAQLVGAMVNGVEYQPWA
ncbi:protein of unknown function [Pseudoduganella namucuonensis]|uniref:DUF4214 domain-containing protein n=2 Tax=Pseudoduganella namucuonensis TaxID=1035707 RepID=A0A1I7LID3_9BURK|nr:protein of unknown function [Pseudoduganella namucuonensis]